MKQILFILLFSIVPLSWAEECYEGSKIQIVGKIVSVERQALSELDAETGIFSSKGMKTIYLLETNDPVCFSTSNGTIDNSETKQIQLILKDSQKSKQKIQFYEELCEQKREANVIRMSCENEYDELDTMLFKFYIDEEDYSDERGGEMEYLTLIWNKRKFYKHDWFSKYKFKYGWDGKWGVLNRETLEFGNLGESSTHKCKVTSKGQFKNEELIHAYHQSEKAKRFLGEKNKF